MPLTYEQIPNVFVIGAPKCGTSSMHDFLALQPGILMSRFKEPHFFAEDLDAPQFIKSPKHYCDLFAGAKGHAYRGESSPLYMYSQKAVPAIRHFNPAAKLIVCLRRPVDAAVSLHNGIYANGKEPVADFMTSFDLQWERKLGHFVRKEGFPRASFDYIGIFSYAEQLKRVFAFFPREQVFVMIYDDLPEAGTKIIPQLSAFLDHPLEGGFPRSNEAKGVRSRLAQRVMIQFPYGVRKALGQVVPSSIKKGLQRGNKVQEVKTTVDPDARARIASHYHADIDATSEILGLSLEHWKKAHQPGTSPP